jgi:ATP phosphoribosyltransferase
MSEKTRIIVPKTGFKADSRNSLGEVFSRAGYDKVSSGEFNDRDIVTQGDYEFLGVKGPQALEYQMLRPSSDAGLPIIMGDDILLDAKERARERIGKNLSLKRTLSMGIGSCRLRFLTPEENKILTLDDLKERDIFTKYPKLLEKILADIGIDTKKIWETNGADTRVAEARDDGNLNTAAFEIVGTGKTARGNKLDISEILPENFSPGNVSTNLSLQNPDNVSKYTADKIKDIGLALESALKDNSRTLITFNIPSSKKNDFLQYGEKGPTISPVVTRDDKSWSALEVAVPNDKADRVFREIMEKGGKNIYRKKLPMGISFEDSEVLKNMS